MGVVREPAMYRCAVGLAGVYDLNKMYVWDNVRETKVGRTFLREYVGTDAADLSANSPALHAAAIKVPVLLAHGHQDEIVNVKFAYAGALSAVVKRRGRVRSRRLAD